ncbi:GMC family oxidoreductase [Pseudonocardia sp. CA-142604]|uniref:GMC family oxidoreductase n=1 Tax=Pseudonocardia sp. CA-142604 TaxID=3240024 RepID=UPI003D91816D
MSFESKIYDFIVVGGGTAGCVLAARLSARTNARVLLLEAGGARLPKGAPIPAAWPNLLQSSACWGDFTTKQAASGTATLLARGRGLGGSSSINGMVFARGHRSSYDAWAADGVTDWRFADLLPYFQRSENAQGRDPMFRGVGGPLTVGPASRPNPVLAACLAAAGEAGHPLVSDVSSGVEEGFGWTDLNIVDGKRQSAADAYLASAADRPNLDIVTRATVHRLRIEDGRCIGVEYSAGRLISAGCADEVILAAGTIGSAQLLMLSGIGPLAHLRDVGIDVVLDLPGVGANLHDHPISNLVYSARRPVPAGRNNHAEALGLLRSRPGIDAPDLQIIFVDGPGHIPYAAAPEQGYTISVSVITPRSRGTLRLADTTPSTPPLLDPNYFGDDHDLDTMVAGLRLGRQIGQASALDMWRGAEVSPGPDVDDDEGLRAYVRSTLASYCHPVGTCRIGVDPMAVVDNELRVHGVDGLRVADGSIIPSVPSANTNATVYAIAERAADLIRATYPEALI